MDCAFSAHSSLAISEVEKLELGWVMFQSVCAEDAAESEVPYPIGETLDRLADRLVSLIFGQPDARRRKVLGTQGPRRRKGRERGRASLSEWEGREVTY